MPYRFGDGEAVGDGLRRLGREQLDLAVRELTDGIGENPVKAVYAARKALKKERSLLRLGGASLHKDDRKREAIRLRDMAQRLSDIRDGHVMAQALDDLAERFAGQVPNKSFAEIRGHLIEQQDTTPLKPGSELLSEVVDELKSARLRIDDWRLDDAGWPPVLDGLVRSYGRGRDAFALARAHPEPENLHEWRKRAKDLWYHLRLLGAISPPTMGGQAQEAHRLADLLGDHHDLAMLEKRLLQIDREIAADVDAVIGLIEHRGGQLQTEAFFLGERLYAERPKAFGRRTHRYWKAWRAETKAAESQRPAELADSTRFSSSVLSDF